MITTRSCWRSMKHTAVLTGMALILACTVSVDSQGETQSTALIDRLPSGATAIFWVDSEAIAAEIPPEQWLAYQEMLENEDDMEDLEMFIEATGIDPRTDVRQLAVAIMPQGAEEAAPVVLLSGSFDRGRLEEFLADGATIPYEGHTLYSVDDGLEALERERSARLGVEPSIETNDSNAPGYLAILDASTVAMGDEETLKLALDVEDGRRDSLKMDPYMNDLISDVAGDGQVWFVASKETWDRRLDELGASGTPVPTGAVESIETVTMSMRFGEGMNMRFTGIAGTPEDAELLAQTLNGWTAMGKMMLQQSEPEIFAILDRAIRVASDDRAVRIEADLTEADVEVLRRLAEEQR